MRVRRRGFAGLILLGWIGAVQAQLPEGRSGVKAEAGARGRSPRCAPLVVEGEVRAGESLRREIGGGLSLVLQAVPHGWVIRVAPSAGPQPAADFAELATPPFRSVNPLLLTTDFGFRSQDVVGWNPRRFRFLRGPGQLAAARRAYQAALASGTPTSAQEAEVARVAAAAAEGEVQILDARLVPGTGDQGRYAALVATHFISTAHTIVQPEQAGAGPLGRVEWLRVRASLRLREQRQRDGSCGGVTP